MRVKCTELVFILDRSGSMAGLEDDTLGGFNSMIEKQKTIDGEVIVSTVLFDHDFKVLHHREPLNKVTPLTRKDYYVRGTTALLDAIGRSIQKIRHIHHQHQETEVPDKTMFIIITDGMENASKEYDTTQIKALIEKTTKENEWEFIFLGANIDAIDVGQRFGMRKDRIANYHADKEGTHLNYEVISDTITHYRRSRTIKEDWQTRINKDYHHRRKK